MKTKFTINEEVFTDNGDLSQCYEYYEKHYQNLGFILDKEHEDVYIVFDKEIQLNEGDRINLYGFRTVSWKCTDLIDGIIEYALVDGI